MLSSSPFQDFSLLRFHWVERIFFLWYSWISYHFLFVYQLTSGRKHQHVCTNIFQNDQMFLRVKIINRDKSFAFITSVVFILTIIKRKASSIMMLLFISLVDSFHIFWSWVKKEKNLWLVNLLIHRSLAKIWERNYVDMSFQRRILMYVWVRPAF